MARRHVQPSPSSLTIAPGPKTWRSSPQPVVAGLLATSLVLTASAGAASTADRGLTRELRDDRLLIGGRVARRADNGLPWVVRCVATAPGCRHRSLAGALEASRSGDLLLVGLGADLDLKGQTLGLPPGVHVLQAGSAPALATQYGPIALADLLPAATTPVQRGVLLLGGGNRVVGLRFEGVSLRTLPPTIGNGSVEIRGNHFQGSFSDHPGGLSPQALPTVWLQGGANHRLVGNRLLRPELRSLISALGNNDNTPAQLVSVCGSSAVKRNRRPVAERGTCLSGNAIRLDHTGSTTVADNGISEALDEAIRIENPRGPIAVVGNRIDTMRQGPDSNMQAAIFTRVSAGHARVSIRNNVIEANAQGILEPADGPTALRGGVLQRPETRNLIDPIEIGLCRGDQTFPRAEDKYGDPGYGDGNCDAASTLALEVVGNQLRPGRQSDADGIDYNVGMGGRLLARTQANRVEAIGEGNSAYTVDLRGNGRIEEQLLANELVADTGISLEIGNLNGLPMNTGRLNAAIEDNTILADSQANPRRVAGRTQANDATGVEIEVQGSNSASAGFDVVVNLRRNRIRVINQAGNPASDALGVSVGSVLFRAKDGTVLQNGRLASGELELTLIGNRVDVTHGADSGRGLALTETIEQGTFRRRLQIGPGNQWRVNGATVGVIDRPAAAGR